MAVYTDMKRKREMRKPRNHVTFFRATLLFWWKMEKWKKKKITAYLRAQHMSVNKTQPYPNVGGHEESNGSFLGPQQMESGK